MGSNRFLDGMLWGMLIGGAAVFLFGTKKGKKLLDVLSEEGVEGLGKVLEDIKEEIEDEEDEILPDMEKKKEEVEDLIAEKMGEKEDLNHVTSKAKVKRFFSSSRKHS